MGTWNNIVTYLFVAVVGLPLVAIMVHNMLFVVVADGYMGLHMPDWQGSNAKALLRPAGRYWRRPFYTMRFYPEVVVPEGGIGLVYANVGANRHATKPGAYHMGLGNFTSVEWFLANGGEEGFQQGVLPPGTYAIHPVAFTVIVIDKNGDQTHYGESALPSQDNPLDGAELNTWTDQYGNIHLTFIPYTEDPVLERQLDARWITQAHPLQLIDYREVGLRSKDGKLSIRLEVSFPGHSSLDNLQLFVSTSLQGEVDMLQPTNASSFIAAVRRWHEGLRTKFGDRYRIAVLDATCRLRVIPGEWQHPQP